MTSAAVAPTGLAFDGASLAADRSRDVVGTELTPIDLLLGRQAELTPVERFARLHEADLVPAGERWWSDRLPSALPEAGQQYAFAVDLDSCTGCKACVSACNSLNGLDGDEQWRTVTTIHGSVPEGPSVLTVTAACHHCIDPACLSGCPVDAYEKDPVTGIVAHLDDQCIGCSYCTLTCPYEVPLYNSSLGIVRKCDMCRGRLAEGEAPACVQGCPNGAITITVIDADDVRADLERELAAVGATDRPRLVPGAPDSTLTAPTTQYRSTRVAAGTFADHRVVAPGHAHTPLAVMLTLTQLAVGTTLVDAAVSATAADHVPRAVSGMALAVALVALAASLGHLGRPLYAWRAVIGFRHSWLSREIVAFGAFAGLGMAHAGAVLIELAPALVTLLRWGTVLVGLVGVACSAVLYAVTGRTWWRVRTSAIRFTGTMLGAGGLLVAAVTLAGAVGTGGPDGSGPVGLATVILVAVVVATTVSLGAVATLLRPRPGPRGGASDDLLATRRLLLGPLLALLRVRVVAAVVGGIVLPAVVVLRLAELGSTGEIGWAAPLAVTGALGLFVVGELFDRRLFFLASVAPRRYGDVS